MPTPGVEPRFYTLEDVATILNVRVAQVYALVRSGELPAVKLGGRGVWRVDRLQIESYIERMHEQTADWARKHPLIGAPEEDRPQRPRRTPRTGAPARPPGGAPRPDRARRPRDSRCRPPRSCRRLRCRPQGRP